MFWSLILAHFLADYPLQPYRLVIAKRQTAGLLLHVFIHLVTMLVLIGPARSYLWPFLLVIAVSHFVIDVFKNWVGKVRPAMVIGPYLLDQLLHILVLIVVTAWAFRAEPAAAELPTVTWQAILLGYTLVTFTWHVTERISAHANPEYLAELARQFYQRMVVRGALFTAFLMIGIGVLPDVAQVSVAGFASVALLPYVNSRFRQREILTDLAVALITTLIVRWVL
jgi:hypothetical protein